MMIVQVINESLNVLPAYETPQSAGMDVRCTEHIVMNPGERVLAKTGLFVEIPAGFEIQVRPRSGLALKQGVTVLNTPGTIDSDYRGEIGVILINHSSTVVEFAKGERIAQLVLSRVERIQWELTDSLSGTKRGQHGFGSTGK
jgi:dUTP pyrophosphatase